MEFPSSHRSQYGLIEKSPETFLWLGDILPESGLGKKRVETPRVGDGVNLEVFPLPTTTYAKWAFSEDIIGTLGIFPRQIPIQLTTKGVLQLFTNEFYKPNREVTTEICLYHRL